MPKTNTDYLVQMLEPEYDRDVLRRKSFKVNIRLLKSSKQYLGIINQVISYLTWVLETEFDDYQSNPSGGTYGVSGANVGMPFNIIAFKYKGETKVMINPVIEKFGNATTACKTNCGSIKLTDKIEFPRPREIKVSYFDIEGAKHTVDLTPTTGSLTVQHEVEHNLGILIIDRFHDEHKKWPKEYLQRLQKGEGKTLDDTLTKRLVFVLSWDVVGATDDKSKVGFNWYSDESDCKKVFNTKVQDKTVNNVKWFTLICPLDTTQEAINKMIEEHIDGEVTL